MFAAAKNRVKYYFAERDPVAIGGPTNFNPFINTANSANGAARATRRRCCTRSRRSFTSVRRRHAGGGNVVPVVVTNDGDAPLIITNVHDRGRRPRRRQRDRGRLRDRQPELLDRQRRPLAPARPPSPTTRRRRTSTRPPRPSRRHLHGQRRLQADAHELHLGRPPAVHVELRRRDGARAAGRQEHGRGARAPSAATSRACCRSASRARSASFGTFVPAVARTYDTALAAIVTTTAGDATLSVTDARRVRPGPPGQRRVRAAAAARRSARLNAAQTRTRRTRRSPRPRARRCLLSWTGPTTAETVTLGFRQAIGATDVLRAGTLQQDADVHAVDHDTLRRQPSAGVPPSGGAPACPLTTLRRLGGSRPTCRTRRR